MIATIIPYKPIASAKMRIRIMPTKSLPSCAFARAPASPTMPIAYPAAYERDGARAYERREAAADARSEVLEALLVGVAVRADLAEQDDAHDEPVDAEDTRHHDRHDVLHD